jgi:hypothetical protein
MPTVGSEAFGDLAGQFPRGGQDQGAAAAARRLLGIGGKALKNRQREGRRLAGAGLGDAEQVLALQQDRDGLGLDRGRRLIALGVEGLQQAGVEAEV